MALANNPTLDLHIEYFGEEFGRIFYLIYSEVAFLNNKWAEFECLFGDISQKEIDIINRTVPMLFNTIKYSILESTILNITRLVDRKNTMGKENLSIYQFPDLVKLEIRLELEKKIDNIRKDSSFCFDWRNRMLGHKDLLLALEISDKKIERATRKSITEILNELEKLLSYILSSYNRSTVSFIAMKRKDGKQLFNLLDRAIN